MNQQTYREIVSGRRRGLPAGLLRCVLYVPALFYSAIILLRNWLYSAGLLKSHQVNAAVICVGNITTGGTGKTPFVVWLCEQLSRHPKLGHRKCAILTRGYKSAQHGDEPALLAQSCPEVPVVVNPDRVTGAAEATGKLGASILVMDDGFQHRRLCRDLDIVTIDATCPFGYGRVIPAGMLREPLGGLKRAHAFVITRCDQVDGADLAAIEQRLSQLNPDAVIAKSSHTPAHVVSSAGDCIDPEKLKGMRVFAFCGIGNPDSFLRTVRDLGTDIVGSQIFNDHYIYTADCLEKISRQACELGTEMILTTMKDWTKIQTLSSGNINPSPAYLAVEIAFFAGDESLRHLIERTVEGRITVN